VRASGGSSAPARAEAVPAKADHGGHGESPAITAAKVGAGLVLAVVGAAAMQFGRHQVAFALKEWQRPWLLGEAMSAQHGATARTYAIFGKQAHIDDAGDAFRHLTGSATLLARAVDHGTPVEQAADLVRRAGTAHELDGLRNPSPLSSTMDLANNEVGIDIGRTLVTAGTTTAQDIETAALDAMREGRAQRLTKAGTLVATKPADVPKVIPPLT
jgi:hypothetical protein